MISTPPPSSVQWMLLMALGIMGPILASLIVTSARSGKNGLCNFLSRIFTWRVHYIWYLAAIAAPICIWLIPTVIHMSLGGSPPILFDRTPYIPSSCDFLQIYSNTYFCIILQFFAIFIINGVTEEPGWRGIGLPEIQGKYNAVFSSVIIGFIHSCWHLPLYFIPGTTKYFPTVEQLFLPFTSFIVVTVLFSFVYTWLYNSTESILLPILSHTIWNLSIDLLRPPTAGYPVGYDVILIVVELVMVFLLICFFGGKKLSKLQNV